MKVNASTSIKWTFVCIRLFKKKRHFCLTPSVSHTLTLETRFPIHFLQQGYQTLTALWLFSGRAKERVERFSFVRVFSILGSGNPNEEVYELSVTPMLKEQEKIVVLDFGSQYNQLITRRIREFGVYSELHPHTITAEDIKAMNATGVIFSGGPNSVYDENAFRVDPAIFDLNVPILGICYGMQLMSLHFGGKVEKASRREYGKSDITVVKESPLFKDLPNEQVVWMSHGDHVTVAPEGFEIIATSPSCSVAAIADESRGLYAVQFHPEVRHSVYGIDLLRQFVFSICKATGHW